MLDMMTNNLQTFCIDEDTLNNQFATITWDLYSNTLAKVNNVTDADLSKCYTGTLVKFLNNIKRSGVNLVLVSLRYDKPLPTTYVDVKYRLVGKTGKQLLDDTLSTYGLFLKW